MDAAVVRPTFTTHGGRPAGALGDDSGAYLFVFLTPAALAHAGVPPTDAGAAAALTEIADGYTLLHTNKVCGHRGARAAPRSPLGIGLRRLRRPTVLVNHRETREACTA